MRIDTEHDTHMYRSSKNLTDYICERHSRQSSTSRISGGPSEKSVEKIKKEGRGSSKEIRSDRSRKLNRSGREEEDAEEGGFRA